MRCIDSLGFPYFLCWNKLRYLYQVWSGNFFWSIGTCWELKNWFGVRLVMWGGGFCRPYWWGRWGRSRCRRSWGVGWRWRCCRLGPVGFATTGGRWTTRIRESTPIDARYNGIGFPFIRIGSAGLSCRMLYLGEPFVSFWVYPFFLNHLFISSQKH